MATCKECVHVGVCRYYTNELAKANGIPLKLEEVERLLECDDCENFKDRSRFVELPCKVGDRLYVTISKSKYIAEYVVIAFWVEESGTIIRIVDTRFFTVSILLTRDIGTRAFLTREEAEQALKERIENDA